MSIEVPRFQSEDTLYFGFLEICKTKDGNYQIFTPSYFIHDFSIQTNMVNYFKNIVTTLEDCSLDNIKEYKKKLLIKYKELELEKLKKETT